MAVGENASSNPFDEPSEDEEIINGTKTSPVSNGGVPRRAVVTQNSTLPFIKILILLICTALVFVLLIAGTATTAIYYPPKKSTTWENQGPIAVDEDHSKLVGPLLLTAGCFMFLVDAVLWIVMVREAYLSCKAVSKAGTNAWNRRNSVKPLPISLVGGPFFIATADPAMAHPPFLPGDFPRPNWVHPNAPLDAQAMDDEFNKRSVIRPETAALSRGQPPCNPEHIPSMRGP